jgi:hypothetical protein
LIVLEAPRGFLKIFLSVWNISQWGHLAFDVEVQLLNPWQASFDPGLGLILS